MTGVAIRAVVDVAANALMLLIRLALAMTVCTRKDGVVRWVSVTGRTNSVRPAVIRREPGVIERRALPRGSCMARVARRREACRGMVRIGRALVVLLVTAVTGRG